MSNQEATGNTTDKTKNDQEERDNTVHCPECNDNFSLKNLFRHTNAYKHKYRVLLKKLEGNTPCDDSKMVTGTPGQAAEGSSLFEDQSCQNSSGSSKSEEMAHRGSKSEERGSKSEERGSKSEEREYTCIIESKVDQLETRPKLRPNLKQDRAT